MSRTERYCIENRIFTVSKSLCKSIYLQFKLKLKSVTAETAPACVAAGDAGGFRACIAPEAGVELRNPS